jgi:hypothetical protein
MSHALAGRLLAALGDWGENKPMPGALPMHFPCRSLTTDSAQIAVTGLRVTHHIGARAFNNSSTERSTGIVQGRALCMRPRRRPGFAGPDPETARAILAAGSIAASTQGTGSSRRGGIPERSTFSYASHQRHAALVKTSSMSGRAGGHGEVRASSWFGSLDPPNKRL